MSQPTLSAALIVKNENHPGFRALLKQLHKFCDEVVVVDTGSTDGTIELAARAGALVYSFAWSDDFSAARNYSFSQCSGDWVVWFDADDVLSDETVEIGKKVKAELLATAPVDVIFTPYNYARDAQGDVALAQMRERFMRMSAKPVWKGRLHEIVADFQTQFIFCPEFVVEHAPDKHHLERKKGRNLAILDQYIDPATTTSTRELYLYGGELRAAERFEESVACYKRYIALWPAEQYDLFQEPYCVYVDLIDSLKRLGRAREALQTCGQAIAEDSSRAEAYALAAMIHYDLGNIAAAFPLFLAAAACKPPTHGGVVYMAFYSKAIREMVEDCKAKLEAAPTAG